MCSASYVIWNWLYNWQTIITGVVAAGAGWAAYKAGVKQATTTRETSAAQIKAIDKQTAALEQQNADLKRAEQERLARERRNVARVMYACIGFVETDVRTAISSLGDWPDNEWVGLKRGVRKYNFDYLRERVGDCKREDIVVAFLALERDIDRLPSEGDSSLMGPLKERLNNLLMQVENLRELARSELGSTQPSPSGAEPPPPDQ